MDIVFTYLKSCFDRVFVTMTDIDVVDKARLFLESLRLSSDPVCKRLAACIAIDLKTGNLTTQQYIETLQYLDSASIEKPHIRFHKATQQYTANYASILPDATCTPDSVQYIRVISLSDYENYYLKYTEHPVLSLNNPSDFGYNYIDTDGPIPFSQDGVIMKGGKDCAWILPYDTLSPLLTKDAWSDEFVDRGGFRIFEFPAGHQTLKGYWYLYLLYPADFNEPVYKSSAVHGAWPNGLFVSAEPLNGWGLTINSQLGDRDTVRERVHMPFHLFISTAKKTAYPIKAYKPSVLTQPHYIADADERAWQIALQRFIALR